MTVTERPLRADAQRNRDRLVTAAAAGFASHGLDVSLEDVARQAGVGIGTLYRHFPSRDDLIEAVFRHEVERVCDAADQLLVAQSSGDALEAWLQRFVEYVATKRGMAMALKSVIGADSELFAYSHDRLRDAVSSLVAAAVLAGEVRSDIEPIDLLRAVSGVCLATDQAGWQDQASRLVTLLMDGMRYGA